MQPTKVHTHNFKLCEEGVFYISPMVEIGFVSRSSKAKMFGFFPPLRASHLPRDAGLHRGGTEAKPMLRAKTC